MRIGLLTDGGYPFATGESRLWCDRLVRGLAQHEFDVFALSRSAGQEERGWIQLPGHVRRVRTAPLWTPADDGRSYGRRDRRRFAGHFQELAGAVCAAGTGGAAEPSATDSTGAPVTEGGTPPTEAAAAFAEGLYGLADLARECGGLYAALRSEVAVRILESACRAPGARRSVHGATVPDYLAFADQLERALRPLSLDWYADDGLSAVDVCHATSGGSAALPGLLAKRFFGVPLLVTEYGAQLRAHYLATGDPRDGAGRPEGGGRAPGEARHGAPVRAPVRALLAGFHGRLAAEVYRQAGAITSGNTHTRRWQQKCGADRARLRTVYPGMEAGRFSAVWDGSDTGDPDTLVWVGRIEPSKDLVTLLHAFARIRVSHPGTRLRIIGAPTQGARDAAYLTHCHALAGRLLPHDAQDTGGSGAPPVSFEEIGGAGTPSAAAVPGQAGPSAAAAAGAPELPDAYAAAAVVVLSSVVEGFPVSLVEAMFCGRATVSTDVGAVVEIVGGTGLVVPPRNPQALADACAGLLSDRARRERLGAAARARALELFTVEQNLAAFHALYLELVARAPAGGQGNEVDSDVAPRPCADTAETYPRGSSAGGRRAPLPRRTPGWADASGPPGAGRHGQVGRPAMNHSLPSVRAGAATEESNA